MTHKRSLTMFLFVLGCAALLVLPAAGQGQSGTTLTDQYVTGEGYWNRIVEYDWTIEKTASETSIHLDGAGASATVYYTIEVTRTQTSDTTVSGVTGEVCETNGGAVATENLTIVVTVEKGAPFSPVPGASVNVDLSSNPILDPGETGCWDFDIPFVPEPGAQYRLSAQITITNHSGHLGVPFGPNPKGDFTMPAAPTLVEIDESANVSDLLVCPAGFTCDITGAGPWYFEGSNSASYEVLVTNLGECGATYYITNTASLLASDGETANDSESVEVTTGPCPPQGEWCSPGYWRQEQHLDSWAATGISPNALYSTYFGLPTISNQGKKAGAPANPTLWQVLQKPEWYGGGAFNNVGDLLSAAHPDVNFDGERVEDSCPLN
jgi:hypothetical protein